MRRWLGLGLLVCLAVAACAPGPPPVNPAWIRPDNAPTRVPGQHNGALPDTLLTRIDANCVIENDAASSFSAMLAAARADGVELAPAECYRDLAGQQYWWNYWCGRGDCGQSNCAMAAYPGTSMHGWGKAVDLRDQGGGLQFSSLGYTWLKAHAARYGFNHPGWAEPGTCAQEPWHWEWVGDGGVLFAGR